MKEARVIVTVRIIAEGTDVECSVRFEFEPRHISPRWITEATDDADATAACRAIDASADAIEATRHDVTGPVVH